MISRRAEAHELAACTAFGNLVFRDAGTDIDFAHAIPKVYASGTDKAPIHRIVTDDAGSIHALVAVLPGMLHTVCGDLKTGYVGTVSVHPESRHLGYMKLLMNEQLQDARAQGLQLLMLGGQRQRYGYFGFAKGGTRWVCSVSRPSVRHALRHIEAYGIRFSPLQEGSAQEAACSALHKNSPAWFERDCYGYVIACRTFEQTPYAALDADGRLLGCITCDSKRPDRVSELLAPDPETMDRLLKAWMENHELRDCSVVMTEWDTALREHLCSWCEHVSLEPACMVLVTDPAAVIGTLLSLKQHLQPLPHGCCCIAVNGHPLTITLDEHGCSVTPGGQPVLQLDDRELGTLLFDPFQPVRADIPQGWFPLPLSVPTADEF